MAACALLACRPGIACLLLGTNARGLSGPCTPAKLLALLQTNSSSAPPVRSNLVVLDEVMQHLDGEGCLRVAQLLKQASGPGFERAGVWGHACSC